MYEEKEIDAKKEKKLKSMDESKNYDEDQKETPKRKLVFKADWVSIFIKLILLLGISFLIIYLFTKFNNGNEEHIFAKNLETMKTAAYSYFKEEEHRPVVVHEEIDLSLQDMIDASIIEPLVDSKKNLCDSTTSYVSLLKKEDTKYLLDVFLTCNGVQKSSQYTFYYNNTDSLASNSTKEEQNVLYEQRRKVKEPETYECPDGYILSGRSCYSNVQTLSTKAVPKYKVTPAKNTKATYHKEEVDYDYVNAIVKTGANQYVCPSGYTLTSGKCRKIVQASLQKKITYSCPYGGKLSGKSCIVETALMQKAPTYSCSKGTLVRENQCQITTNVSKKCRYGAYDSTKKSCYVTYDAIKTWGAWNYIGLVSSSGTLKSTNSTRYVKYKIMGTKTIYKKYTRKQVYKCTTGTYYKNGKCRDYDPLYIETYCKDGSFKLNSSKTVCYKYVAASKKTSPSYCPDGYTKSGSMCRKVVAAASNTKESYSCPSGYSLTTDHRCVKELSATIKTGTKVYSCPDGYTKTGSGSNTKCYKKRVKQGYYSCTDPNAILEEDRCIIPSVTTFVGYNCPSSYELSNDMCYRFTKSEKINATKVSGGTTREEKIWSQEKNLDGWIWTGKTKEI